MALPYPETTVPATLLDAYWPAAGGTRAWRPFVLAVVGSGLLAISAKISVPMVPVPISMQTFVVLVIGAAFGWRLAGATVLLYLVEGIAGLPVFSQGAGPAYFAGTTGGYLVGFLAAAVLVGWLAERGWDRSVAWTAAAMVLGNVVIYVLGLAWLYVVITTIRGVDGFGLPQLLAAGLTPFLIGDALKIALASALLPLAWRSRR